MEEQQVPVVRVPGRLDEVVLPGAASVAHLCPAQAPQAATAVDEVQLGLLLPATAVVVEPRSETVGLVLARLAELRLRAKARAAALEAHSAKALELGPRDRYAHPVFRWAPAL